VKNIQNQKGKERPTEAPLPFLGFVIFHYRDYERKARSRPKMNEGMIE